MPDVLSAIMARLDIIIFCTFLHAGFDCLHPADIELENYWQTSICSLGYVLSAHSVIFECLLFVKIWQPIL